MKYKILPNTPLFEALVALRDKIKAADAVAKALSDKCGAYAYSGGRGVGGGIRALCFKEKPEHFKLLQYPDYYYPKVSLKVNRELVNELAALPEVKDAELNELVGFKSGMKIDELSGGFRRTQRPGIMWDEKTGIALLDTGEGSCAPHPDLVEILESEYLALQGK
jgi:hypothetical protein